MECLFGQLNRGTECATQASRCADCIGIESNTLTNTTDDLAAHTEWQDNCVVGKTWNHVNRSFDRDTIDSQFDHYCFFFTTAKIRLVGLKRALCSFKEGAVLVHRLLRWEDLNALCAFELLRKCWADLNRIIPSQLGDRIRALHHPAVIGVATVVSM